MAIKAKGQITLSSVVDVKATYRYYLLQSSTLNKPSKPTVYPPSSSWDDTEPSYTDGSTNSLYFVDCTVFCDDTFAYSEVSLSSSYEAAKAAYNKASNAQSSIDNLEIGSRNCLRQTNVSEYISKWNAWSSSILELTDNGYLKVYTNSEDTAIGAYPPKISTIEQGVEYTLSFDAYADSNIELDYCYIICSSGNYPFGIAIPITQTSNKYKYTFVSPNDYTDCSVMIGYNDSAGITSAFYLKNLMLEKGNRATDWSPAPEDIAEEVEYAKEQANDALSRSTSAQLDINRIKGIISTLITDKNGTSLITQDSQGWAISFDISSITDTLNEATEDINNLNSETSNINNQISGINSALSDLGVLNEYVIITTHNGQPCIELGKTGSNFKIRITNTDIQFIDGSTMPAYINNQKLHISTADVDDELQFGGFAWKKRSNGNMGLIWKGDVD